MLFRILLSNGWQRARFTLPLALKHSQMSSQITQRPTCGIFSLPGPSIQLIQKRFKKSNRFVEHTDDEQEESDADESDLEGETDSKVMHKTVIALRLDAVGKTCFGMPRAKFEECFYNGMIRINGERVAKKNYEIGQCDEIDLILGNNLEDRSQLDVKRVNILKVDDKAASAGRIRISFRITNNLKIDNYKRDPFEDCL